MTRLLILCVALTITSCAAVPPAPPVTVTRTIYVPLPQADLAPCTYTAQVLSDNQSLLLAQQSAIAALAACAAKLDDIRHIDAQAADRP